MTNYIGIDPGLYGAVAYLMEDGRLDIWDMPVVEITEGKINPKTKKRGKGKTVVNAVALSDVLEDLHGEGFLERVGPMPKQGVTSVFSFGRSYGVVIGILAAFEIPLTYVTPQQWKKVLRVPKSKDAARARASELMPRHSGLWPLKKHDGRAEAALIAYYGWKQCL